MTAFGRAAACSALGWVMGAVLATPLAALAAAPTPLDEARCQAPVAREQPPSSEAARALEQGNQLASEDDLDAASDAYRNAALLAREGGEDRLALLADANALRVAIDAGRYDGIDVELESVEAAAAAIERPTARARLQIHVARSWTRLAEQRPLQATDYGRRAVALLQAAEASAIDAGDQRLRSYALGNRAELYERAGRGADALALNRRALFAAQQADAQDARYRWEWALGRLAREQGDVEGAIHAYRRAVSTLAELRSRTAFGSRDSEYSFRVGVEPVYSGLVDLLLTNAAVVVTPGLREALLAEARDTVEAQKAAELRDYFEDPCLSDQRKQTPDEIPGTVVVYPILLDDRVEFIVSAEGTIESYLAPVGPVKFVEEIRNFRRTLGKRTTRQYLRPAANLYDWMIRPFQAAVALEELEALVFVPGGALRTVPFGALYDKETGEYLIEKVPVAVTPGLTLTNPRPIDRNHVQLLSAGLSESVQGYPALESVSGELVSVNENFPGDVLLNAEFVVDRFARSISEQPFGIVHIASHAEFSSEISESFLLAWDRKLTMNQLSAIVGTTKFRERPLELLTLSACQTAAGDDRAALGLAGVALRAGARSALATLWSVNDQASAELVAEFYRLLANPEISRARALQRAQIKILRMHHYRHPGYWAPYLLISSWL